MGLLTKLLTLPVMGPIKGIVWIAEKVAEQADKELYDEDKVRGQFMELELRYDLGEISEEEYLAAEEALLERLRVIRERQAAEREG
ncbi:MAG: gas vesicle protein GvpG [Chloroflexi bacterium]|nr:gas vesicle protein GvpG [Chloroflexota bacterium]